MPNQPFRLEPLLKLRRSLRDQRRRDLAQAQEAEQLLHSQKDQLALEMNELQIRMRQQASPGTVDVEALLAVKRHLLLLEAEGKAIDERMQQLAAEIHRRHEALVQADRDTRVMEKLQERHHLREQETQFRQEMIQLDEIGLRCRQTEVE